MKLDITEIMNRRKSEMNFSFDFDFPTEGEYASLPEGVCLNESARVDCRVTDVNGFIKAEFDVSADLRCVCDRCLTEFIYPLDFSFERFAQSDGEEGEDTVEIKESGIFPDFDLCEEISLEAPYHPVCSEDCPGLCPKCGKRLSEGKCGCAPEEKPLDPRMDALRRLRDSMSDD